MSNNEWPYRPPRDPRRDQVETLFASGWTDPKMIQHLMARDDSEPPSLLTIRRWINPDLDRRCRESSRRHMRRKRALAKLDDLPRLTEAEMWELALEV